MGTDGAVMLTKRGQSSDELHNHHISMFLLSKDITDAYGITAFMCLNVVLFKGIFVVLLFVFMPMATIGTHTTLVS